MGMKPVVGLVGCFWLGMALGGCDCCRSKGSHAYNTQPTFPPQGAPTTQAAPPPGSQTFQPVAGTGAGSSAGQNLYPPNTATGMSPGSTGATNPSIAASSGTPGLSMGDPSSASNIQRAGFQETSPSGSSTAGMNGTMTRYTDTPVMHTPPTPGSRYDVPPTPTGLPKSTATDSSLSGVQSDGYAKWPTKPGAPVPAHDVASGAGSTTATRVSPPSDPMISAPSGLPSSSQPLTRSSGATATDGAGTLTSPSSTPLATSPGGFGGGSAIPSGSPPSSSSSSGSSTPGGSLPGIQ
jgi:hypothetical protein